MKSKVKQLEEKFGGRWKYSGQRFWECDDLIRMVWAVAGHLCDDENCDVPAKYYMYGDGTAKEVYFEGQNLYGGSCLGMM